MYNLVIRHIYNLQRDHPYKFSTPRHHTQLLTTFPMLYFPSSGLFWNYQSVLLNSFPFFTHSPNPFSSGDSQNGLCIYESLCSAWIIYFVFRVLILVKSKRLMWLAATESFDSAAGEKQRRYWILLVYRQTLPLCTNVSAKRSGSFCTASRRHLPSSYGSCWAVDRPAVGMLTKEEGVLVS